MEKLGIFGGSFNPPHYSHLYAAKLFIDEFVLDKLVVVPSGNVPHKEIAENISKRHRFEMAKLFFKDFLVCDYETNKEGVCYTIDTLRYIKKRYIADEYLLLIGSDMFLSFSTWYEYEEILKQCVLCVILRENCKEEVIKQKKLFENKFNCKINLLNALAKPMSSTEVREKIRKNEDVSCYISQNVLKYIKDNKLYT
jgi:nicotinate-nucleotide adenylyltransferase